MTTFARVGPLSPWRFVLRWSLLSVISWGSLHLSRPPLQKTHLWGTKKPVHFILFLPVHCMSQADVMLVKNAQNLMQAVTNTISAAEAAYVKVLCNDYSEFCCVWFCNINLPCDNNDMILQCCLSHRVSRSQRARRRMRPWLWPFSGRGSCTVTEPWRPFVHHWEPVDCGSWTGTDSPLHPQWSDIPRDGNHIRLALETTTIVYKVVVL